MARPKKAGKRATGIQGRQGFLYIIKNQQINDNGIQKAKKLWIPTFLEDTKENIPKAVEIRKQIFGKKQELNIDINITLSDFIDSFLEEKRRKVADTTYAAYVNRGKHIKTVLGEKRIRSITVDDVESLFDYLFTQKHVQERYVKDIKVLFSEILDNAQYKGLISDNPSRDATISKRLISQEAKSKHDENFFTYDEAIRFLSIIENEPYYEMFYLILYFALRREEILGLRWSSIDLNRKKMFIEHTVTKGTKINRLNQTKTETSRREYPLNDEQVVLFNHLKERENQHRELFGDSYNDNDYIFKNIDGSPYYPDYPTKLFKKIVKRNPDLTQSITLHGLRTSCVSILVHNNVDIKTIQKWVGHKDMNTTLKIYTKVKDREAKEELSKELGNLFPLKKYDDNINDQEHSSVNTENNE